MNEIVRQKLKIRRKKSAKQQSAQARLPLPETEPDLRCLNQQKMGYLSQEVVDNIKFANKPIKETKSLFGKFGKMAKGFADGITNWVQKAPVIGKVVKSKLFLGTASFLGFGLAVLTLLTGLTNIVKASTIAYSDHIEKSKFLNSLDEQDND